jgi:choline dehydrogenase-like flavoprotein
VLVDARSLAAGACLEADVCVVGAGPAGLAVTSELDGRGPNVVVLAGPAEAAPDEVSGDPYPALADTRAGGIGGTAALWDAELAPGSFGARYAPLEPIDFEERDGLPGSGWPFGRDALDPFYARAHELCVAGPYDYEPAATEALRADGIASGLFRFGLAEPFTRAQRDRLAASDARVLTEATATRIGTDEGGGAVSHVEATSEPGRTFTVKSRAYVLAAGGIENPRLLLVSGLGAGRDLVGRCFMDHPTIRCRLELAGDGAELGFYDVRSVEQALVLGRLELPEETLRREALLNGGFILAPARERELRATQAAKAMAHAARERRLPPQPIRTARDTLAGLDAIAFAAHCRLTRAVPKLAPSLRLWRRSALLDTLGLGPVSGWSRQPRRSRAYDLYHVIEQAPDPERRVTLGSERDRFGLPLASLRWFVGERELASAERAEELMRDGLAHYGVLRKGRELAPGGDLLAAVHPSAHHHLGTTRMHAEERHGVVDADGRVHGLANLYVAGGSVVPTSGFVNPTLTIVALALRLGAYLRQDVSR